MPSLRDAVGYLKVQNKIKEQNVTKIHFIQPVFLIKQKKKRIALTQIRHKPDEIVRHHLGFAFQT